MIGRVTKTLLRTYRVVIWAHLGDERKIRRLILIVQLQQLLLLLCSYYTTDVKLVGRGALFVSK
jgi:hypothetical protein